MGPKKPKKTKEEKAAEKLAKELEEKKQKELEEKRMLIEAEKKRVEDLKLQEMRKVIRESELNRLRVELEIFLQNIATNQTQLEIERKVYEEQIQWEAYLAPTDEPEPSDERGLNTFISVVRETAVTTFADALPLCKKIENVTKPLRMQWGNDLAAKNLAMQSRSTEYIDIMSQLVLEKIDDATLNLLRMVDLHLNDKAELSVEENIGGIFVGMWAYFGSAPLARKEVKFNKIGFELSVPKQILQQETRFVHRVIRYLFETQSSFAYIADSRPELAGNISKFVVGDLHLVELLLPPPSASKIRAKKWTIRDRSALSTKLRKSPYPSSANMKCVLHIPETIFGSNDLTAATWNHDLSDWVETGIADFQWNEAERKAEFYLTTLGTIALVKDRVADMPYKGWSLRAVRNIPSIGSDVPEAAYEQHTRFSLSTQKVNLVIDIVGSLCRLVQPDDKSTADIIGKSMTPGGLCGLLLSRGLNIIPTEHDLHRAIGKASSVKDLRLEEDVLREIARLSNAVDFEGHAMWNSTLKSSQIGFLAQESTMFTCNEEAFDFECILAERDDDSESHRNAPSVGVLPSPGVKFTLVLGNEYNTKETFSLQPRPNEVSHIDLSAALRSRTTDECRERVERASPMFQDAVFSLLRLVHPLILCYEERSANNSTTINTGKEEYDEKSDEKKDEE